MAELKPCPFCGHEGKIENLNSSNRFYHRKLPYRVKCSFCSCALAYTFFRTKKEAKDAWNTRLGGVSNGQD